MGLFKTNVRVTEVAMPSSIHKRDLEASETSSLDNTRILKMPHAFRNNMVATMGEFVGTFMFLFFAFSGAQIANSQPATANSGPDTIRLLYISLSFGASLTANVWAFYRITGGQFNPAVTIALCLVGGQPILRGCLIIVAQLLGATAAAGLASLVLPGPLKVTNALGSNVTATQGFFIEALLTAQLVFVILMLAVEKHKSTYMAPAAIGTTLFLAHLVGVNWSGGSLNPARSFGPALIGMNFPTFHWIYWFGPITGAALSSSFFYVLQLVRYTDCNPGQDWNDIEKKFSLSANRPGSSNATQI